MMASRTGLLCFVLAEAALSAGDPMVWFALSMPQPRPNVSWRGSPEYMSLFEAGAPWQKAARHVNVFKISGYMAHVAPEPELRRMFTDLDRRGIALGLDVGVLTRSGCGTGVEGFDGRSALVAARRIRAFGGVLRYVSMDEPFFFGSMYTGHDACRWSTGEVAANAAANIKALKSEFPAVIIGDSEPLPAYIPGWIDRYREWIDAYRAAVGSDLAFLHADVQWQNGAWPRTLDALRQMIEQRGIPFGVFYNGYGLDQTDAEWIDHAQEHFERYEVSGATPPAQVLFQSWDPHPQHLLPETDTVSITNLINRYFRTRTRLTVRTSRGSLDGRLTDAAGKPLAGLPVELIATPTGGDGQPAEYVISGTVPAAAEEAMLGFRVNVNCGCSGPSDFTLHTLRYKEDAAGSVEAQRDFSKGLEGWGLSNREAGRLESGSLHVSAAAGQVVTLNSAKFRVTPGASYTLRIRARVAPRSVGSGYFAIFFPGAKAVKLAPFQAPDVELATFQTKAGGSYQFRIPPHLEEQELHVKFPGNEALWPADSRRRAGRQPI